MSKSELPTWSERDALIREMLPEVPSKLRGNELLPAEIRTVLNNMPDGSPFAVVAFLFLLTILGGVAGVIITLLETPPVVPGLYLGGLFLAYIYILQSGFDAPASEGLYEDHPFGGKLVQERSVGGKLKAFSALIPGVALTLIIVFGGVAVIILILLPLFEPLPGLLYFSVMVLLPYFVGGRYQGRIENSGMVTGIEHKMVELYQRQYVRDIVSVPLGVVLTLLSFVVGGLALLIPIAFVGGLIQSPELIPVAIGIALAYFGFVFHEIFLKAIGSIVGLVGGGIFGFVVLPAILTEAPTLNGRLGMGIVSAVVFSNILRKALPALHRLSIELGGFALGVISTFLLLPWYAPGLDTWILASISGIVGGLMAILVWWGFVAYIIILTSSLGGVIVGGFIGSNLVAIGIIITGIVFQWLVYASSDDYDEASAREGSSMTGR